MRDVFNFPEGVLPRGSIKSVYVYVYRTSILSWPEDSTLNPLLLSCYYDASIKSHPSSWYSEWICCSGDNFIGAVRHVHFSRRKQKDPDHFSPSLTKGFSNHDHGRLPITIKSVSATYDNCHPTSLSADTHQVVLLKQANWLFATCFCYKHCFHQGFVNCWENDWVRVTLLLLTTSFNNLHEHKRRRLHDSMSGTPCWLDMFITWDPSLRHSSPGSVQVLDLLWLQHNAQ